ncbi:serine/threonine-protein kinase BLUS1-like isoform X2 [Cynara cardunculus var. scolymus]|uniref:serine/threonine-protein kinase BLUS1-like isoform X2 n=1 Tax=Cynara cardunculus var. scolymus TaxID=59895 RepID=UPI000D62FDD9|nr:serine/threonine-protein kinase BLUS1-like isoform X2 [Cynara cardunculus var. scolymus]
MEVPKHKFPVNAEDYKLYEEVGEGVSASVYRALCVPLNKIVAIKVLDLEKCNNDLDGIRREVQIMSLINHPNLLRAYCSFTTGHNLWVVMPYMAGGSCLHIMKTSFQEGFEEPVIATVLREVLKALVYLHVHGHIHRDVKAGNILVDSNGSIKLADFGVSACMFDTGDRQRSRNTFVGTPCWMAPEVMQQLHGYDFKADIWSFGITALELAHGHAPFSKYPPMKVLLMTLQNAPPGLDYERDKKFSKSFKEMVAACLVKDPKKRPSSEKLMKHPFFKHARTTDYLQRTILDGLPPLGDRFRILKAKEADLLLQNSELNGSKEHLSQQEYIRGISAWNFNLEDLKNQAALIQDYDENSDTKDLNASSKQQNGVNYVGLPAENSDDGSIEDEINEIPTLEDSFAAFPIKPLQALKGCFDVGDDDEVTVNPTAGDENQSDNEQHGAMKPSLKAEERVEQNEAEHLEKRKSLPLPIIMGTKKYSSGSLLPDNVLSSKKLAGDFDREYTHLGFRVERSYSGPLQGRQKNSTINSSSNDVPEEAVVQQKGRFKVTSADLSLKAPVVNSSFSETISPRASSIAASLLPSLQSILHHNTLQREELYRLIKLVEQSSGNPMEYVEAGTNGSSPIPLISPRERELQSQVIQLQQRNLILAEQLQRQKMRNVQALKLKYRKL